MGVMVLHDTSAAVSDGMCLACGGPTPRDRRNKYEVKYQKYCSGRCRKSQYGDHCVDCGGRTTYGAEQARVPEPRCEGCRRCKDSDRRVTRAMAMLELRRNGVLSDRVIAEQVGCAIHTVQQELSRLRALGFPSPPGVHAGSPHADPSSRSPDRETAVLGRSLAERGFYPELAEAAA